MLALKNKLLRADRGFPACLPLPLLQQGGGMGGGMGGPMDFARNKSKFQEIPETGVTFQDVAVSQGATASSLSQLHFCPVPE
jgi:cell division protease FtsH